MNLRQELAYSEDIEEILEIVKEWLEQKGDTIGFNLVREEILFSVNATETQYTRGKLEGYNDGFNEGKEEALEYDPTEEYESGWDGGVNVGWEEAMNRMTFGKLLKWKLFGVSELDNQADPEFIIAVQKTLQENRESKPILSAA